jgi:hypothetical protein
MAAGTTHLLNERRIFRARTIEVMRAPHDSNAHLARLHAAIQLDDSEPLQGVLADIFVALPVEDEKTRQTALQITASRLSRFVTESFSRYIHGPLPPIVTTLATRWSVIANPSSNVPARVRRASPDHSRRMAISVVSALQTSDPALSPKIENDFLDHCIFCQDKLAFILARCDLRRHEIALGDRWMQVAGWLEAYNTHGSRMENTPENPSLPIE